MPLFSELLAQHQLGLVSIICWCESRSFSSCSPSVGLADGHLHHLVPTAVDEGLGGRHALRWPFDADLAVAALDWTTVDVPLLHWQLKFLHHTTPFPGLRSKELWYSSVLKSSSSKECSSFSSCASRTSPTAVAIIHSNTEEAHYRKLVFLRPHTYTVPERRQACLFTGLPRRVLLGNLWLNRA